MGIATTDCEKTDLMSVHSGALVATFVKHRQAKHAGVIFSIDWVAWGRTGCQSC